MYHVKEKTRVMVKIALCFINPFKSCGFFQKIKDGGRFFENLRVFPTIDFWRFFWTCSGGVVEHVPEEKRCHLFFSFFGQILA